jgi:hypothetical protein
MSAHMSKLGKEVEQNTATLTFLTEEVVEVGQSDAERQGEVMPAH